MPNRFAGSSAQEGRAGLGRDDRRAGPGARRGRGAGPGLRVCHTDLHYREGGITDEFPQVTGMACRIGEHAFSIDPHDSLVSGFLPR